MVKQFMLTDSGREELETELNQLKTVRRKEIAEKIKTALSFGDLSENSEYDEAKNEQGKVENRINEIENILNNMTIIDESDLPTDTVSVGSKVVVLDVEYKEEIQYKVVGAAEANPKKGRISDESPIGKALIGKKAGDVLRVAAPAGEIKYKLVKIL